MTRYCGIDDPVYSREDRIPSSPAEADDADFARSGDFTDCGDEYFNEGLGYGFPVFKHPWGKSSAYCGGGFGLVDEGLLLSIFEWRFNGLKKVDGERVALMNIGNITVETSFGIVIGEKADIFKIIAEDYETLATRYQE